MDRIAVFGTMDTLVGQVLEFMDGMFEVECFISINEIPELDVEAQHASRPNSKTEFVENGLFQGKEVIVTEAYLELLKDKQISKCLVLEGDKYIRRDILESLKKNNIDVLSYIHPTAVLVGQNTVDDGVIIFPKCYIGYKADVLEGTIMQANCTLEHHSVVGRYCDINPNLTTGGFVKIEDFCEINMSVDIVNRLTIGKGARVGAGSLVMSDVGEKELWYGRPARYVRRN